MNIQLATLALITSRRKRQQVIVLRWELVNGQKYLSHAFNLAISWYQRGFCCCLLLETKTETDRVLIGSIYSLFAKLSKMVSKLYIVPENVEHVKWKCLSTSWKVSPKLKSNLSNPHFSLSKGSNSFSNSCVSLSEASKISAMFRAISANS